MKTHMTGHPFCRVARRAALPIRVVILLVLVFILSPGGTAMAQLSSQDAYPMGTVAFFNRIDGCPPGWAAAQNLSGLTVVPFTSIPTGQLGLTVGGALYPGAQPSHSHAVASSITLREVKYVGVVGCCDENTSPDGPVQVTAQSADDESGLPYVILLVCQKMASQQSSNPATGVPANIAPLFGMPACPGGWKSTPLTNGRFLVGLPAGGTPGATFGGPPLSFGENRTHSHGFAATFVVPSTPVKLLSGCCAEHYGGQGNYPFQGTTSAAAVGFPYGVATQCQPCTAGDPACQGQ